LAEGELPMSSPEELRTQARAAYERGDLEGALGLYRRLAEALPDDAQVLNDLGTVCFALGRTDESRTCLVRALELDSEHPEARQNLEMLSRALGATPQQVVRAAAQGRPNGIDISAVVPVRGNFEALDRCLDALHGQSLAPGRYEVLLVANGMERAERQELDELLKSWRPHFGRRLVELTLQDASIPAARNEGVRHARGRIVLQMNQDTVLSRTALAQHFARHEACGFDPKCVVVGGRKFTETLLQNLFNYLYEAVPLYTPLHVPPARFEVDAAWFVTCNLSCPQESYRRFGMFDPSYQWGSDTALGRAWRDKHGVRVYVDTGIVSYHLHDLSFDSWKANCLKRAVYNMTIRTGKQPDQLSDQERGWVLEQLEWAWVLAPDQVERELRRLEEEFPGPGAFCGATFMGARLRTLEEMVEYLRPVLMRYKAYLQYGEIWRQSVGDGAAALATPSRRAVPVPTVEERESLLMAEAAARRERGACIAALPIYHLLLRLKPRDAPILTALAETHTALGQLAEGEHYCLEALEADPDHAPARRRLEELHPGTRKSAEEMLREAGSAGQCRCDERPQVTVVLVNYRRVQNLKAVLDCLSDQTVPVQVFLWNNAYGGPRAAGQAEAGPDRQDLLEAATHPLVKLCVESSRNMRCWPRWLLASMANTEYICSMDDDLVFTDARVLEDAVWASRTKCPEGVVGFFGWQRVPGESYRNSSHESGNLQDRWVDFIKGRFMLFRRELLERVPLAHPVFRDVDALLRRADDFYVNICISRGERNAHLVPGILGFRYENLPTWHTGLATEKGHWDERDDLVRRMFEFYEGEGSGAKPPRAAAESTGSSTVPQDLTSVYPLRWYRQRERYRGSYHGFARAIQEVFAPDGLVDLGCGAGYIVEFFAGRIPVLGIDGSRGAVKAQSERARPFCVCRDLTVPPPSDLVEALEFAVCIEVAEHIPPDQVDSFLAWFSHADRVLFTAAPPGQGGLHHVNEQPPEYWQQKFADLGFRFRPDESERWQRRARAYADGCRWVVRNAMFFERRAAS